MTTITDNNMDNMSLGIKNLLKMLIFDPLTFVTDDI